MTCREKGPDQPSLCATACSGMGLVKSRAGSDALGRGPTDARAIAGIGSAYVGSIPAAGGCQKEGGMINFWWAIGAFYLGMFAAFVLFALFSANK